jgi:hypothetical protein
MTNQHQDNASTPPPIPLWQTALFFGVPGVLAGWQRGADPW